MSESSCMLKETEKIKLMNIVSTPKSKGQYEKRLVASGHRMRNDKLPYLLTRQELSVNRSSTRAQSKEERHRHICSNVMICRLRDFDLFGFVQRWKFSLDFTLSETDGVKDYVYPRLSALICRWVVHREWLML